jgi:O-antigen/teichoic acid export membrane protein
MKNLKEKALRGAALRVCAQVANLLLRVGSLVILARLLEPRDFGLVGMVTAVTGVLSLFRDFGLSAATVQRAKITEAQTGTLFWINLVVGVFLAAATAASAPVVARFYHEPRLYWITIVVASAFVFNAAGIQHSARLQREMRFATLSVIDTGSWLISTTVAIAAAKAGYGYWSLVAMTVTLPLASTTAFWLSTAWVPQMPSRRSGISSMMRFGGTITITGVVVYIASNFEKVLLGRYWGADAIGIYGRAYQLIRIPTDTLNVAVGEVAFSALSRLQDDPPRLKRFFLKGYSLVLALTLPATVACCIFATDWIFVLLGPKWREAAPIFRLLTPTILVFALANPLSWLLSALGIVTRGVKMSLVIAPLMIASYFVGLPYGPNGVAVAYSAIMTFWLIPVIAWSVHGTVLSFRNILMAAAPPFVSSAVAGTLALIVSVWCGPSHLERLIVGCTVLCVTYLGLLLFGMGQKSFYLDVIRRFARPSSLDESVLLSA